MNIQDDYLRAWWIETLHDMLRATPLAERRNAVWQMNGRLCWILTNLIAPQTLVVSIPPTPVHGYTLLGLPIVIVDQDFVSLETEGISA